EGLLARCSWRTNLLPHACKAMTSATNFREDLSFLLTNRVPRRWLTLFMGWLSPIEQPLVKSTGLALWKMFSDLDLSDAKKSEFRSIQDCFTRELREGARPVTPDPRTLGSPCDAIVGASGTVNAGTVVQAKGFPYALGELLGDPALAAQYEGGRFV